MPKAKAWFTGNDMLVQITGIASSTNTGTYINNSTGVTVSIWQSDTTNASTNRLVSSAVMSAYSTAGAYRYSAQSTGVAPSVGVKGMAIVVLNHAGLNGEWRAPFLVQRRGTT